MRRSLLAPAACSAPGRLDFLGGVADYSGSLVLEMPTQAQTTATLLPEAGEEARFASPLFGATALALAPIRDLMESGAEPGEFRAHLDETKFPHWARYPLGCFIMLARHARWFPETGFSLQIDSSVPDGQGVSSSAALEVATLRAFNEAGGLRVPAIELARLGQRAENLIVGAACGLMDQLASSCGPAGALLPILCRPDTLYDPAPLPEGLALAGWPSGVRHRVGASPYATARAAAFMGRRILETRAGQRWTHTAEIPLEIWRRFEEELPVSMSGADYSETYRDTDDPLSKIAPDHFYPIRAATRFPIEENARSHRALELLSHYAVDPLSRARELRAILKASHDGYGAMGLGSPATDAFLDRLLAEPVESGLIGGRISGGGSGGTVVVLFEKGALSQLRSLAAGSPVGEMIF